MTAVGEGLVSCSIRKSRTQLSYWVHYSLYRTLKVAAEAAVARDAAAAAAAAQYNYRANVRTSMRSDVQRVLLLTAKLPRIM